MESVLAELANEPWSTLVVASGPVDGGAASSSTSTSTSSSSYFIKSKFTTASYSFLVTDLQSVWLQSCDRNEVKRLKQEFNPLVDSPVARILQLVKHSLLDAAMSSREQHTSAPPPVKHHIELKEDGQLSLQFSTKIDFYCFKWTFDCTPLKDEEQRISFIRTCFLQPLLVVTNELQQQLRDLKSIIAQKDAEIAEYKLKGIKLPKAAQTVRFDASEYEKKRLASSSFRRSLREPTLSMDGVTGKIFQMLTTTTDEERAVLTRHLSCTSLPSQAPTPTPSASDFPSPGENKNKRARLTATTSPHEAPSLSPSGGAGADDAFYTSSQSCSDLGCPDGEVNTLSYMESPDEAVRKRAIRERLEALAKKKEEKKQVKATKRKFQFI